MKQISKVAKQFIKRQLKENISFESLAEYAKQIGYNIIFFTPEKPDDIIINCNLLDVAKTRHAFTIKKNNINYIFIDASIHLDNKLHSLAHELAHIVLGHLDVNKYLANIRQQDMEADAFAHAVLNYKSRKSLYAVITAVLLVIALAVCGITYHIHTVKADSNMVYITPMGEKYHSENCIYVKGKDCTAVSELQAEKNYGSCKVCNP